MSRNYFAELETFDDNVNWPICNAYVHDSRTAVSLEGFNYIIFTIQSSNKALFDRKIEKYFKETGLDTRGECDGYCGTYGCDEEEYCNGVQYGLHCNITSYENETLYLRVYVEPQYICDGFLDCPNRTDEFECGTYRQQDDYEQFFVDSKKREMCIRNIPLQQEIGFSSPYLTLKDTVRCSALHYVDGVYSKSIKNLISDPIKSLSKTPYQPLCERYLDQTNCADPQRVAITCKINGVASTVAKTAICIQNHGLCDDGFDNLCVGTSVSCYVHKHQLCNGKYDCLDESDENLADCQSLTESSCFRRYRHERRLRIPITWIRDGINDCENGDDERYDWPTCGAERFVHFVTTERSKNCQEVFICSPGSADFVDLDNFCNSDKCGHLKLCFQEQSRKNDVYSIQSWNVGKADNKEMLSYCIKGAMKSLSKHIAPCVEENFNPAKIFGVENLESSIMIPDTVVDCKNLFGKAYLYFSCSGRCVDQPQCPLKAPRYDGCTVENKIKGRVFTTFEIDENNRLTFLHKNRISGKYENRNFHCKNDKCIDFQNVCNLVDDCGDGSDEELCLNNFSCDKPKRYIPRSYHCDGKIDCNDFSDECNDSCGKTILPGLSFRIFSWIVGSTAVILNLSKIFSNFKVLFTKGYTTTLNDKILTAVLHFGDLFTGIYLLIIAIVDSLIYGSSYCTDRFKWLSDDKCASLGVLSTFGAQLSLLAMTCLSIFRAIGTNKINIYTSRHGGIKMLTLVFILITLSFFIAYVPLMDRYEDFFINAMTYTEGIKIFPSIATREMHLAKIKQYYRRILISRVKTWKKINQLTDEMFSQQYEGLGRRKIHFYGNDGVCLFKYFVLNKDPQRAYIWGCLSWNFVCFLTIFVCYTKVLFFSKNSERQLKRRRNKNQNEDEADEDERKTQKYVSAVILTDFLCWIPFIVLCVLHSFEVIDATPLYTVSSIVILPINSMINPILYNNVLSTTCKRMLMRGRGCLIRIHTYYTEKIISSNNQVNARRDNPREEIEMRPMPNQSQIADIIVSNELATEQRETEF